jgi:hypothetical protein
LKTNFKNLTHYETLYFTKNINNRIFPAGWSGEEFGQGIDFQRLFGKKM